MKEELVANIKYAVWSSGKRKSEKSLNLEIMRFK